MTNENKLREERVEIKYDYPNITGEITVNGKVFIPKDFLHSHTKEVVADKVRGMKMELPSTPCEICPSCHSGWVCIERVRAETYNKAFDDLLASLEDNKK